MLSKESAHLVTRHKDIPNRIIKERIEVEKYICFLYLSLIYFPYFLAIF